MYSEFQYLNISKTFFSSETSSFLLRREQNTSSKVERAGGDNTGVRGALTPVREK